MIFLFETRESKRGSSSQADLQQIDLAGSLPYQGDNIKPPLKDFSAKCLKSRFYFFKIGPAKSILFARCVFSKITVFDDFHL